MYTGNVQGKILFVIQSWNQQNPKVPQIRKQPRILCRDLFFIHASLKTTMTEHCTAILPDTEPRLGINLHVFCG